MTDHHTIHRFIPATDKHGNKTACGIKVGEAQPVWSDDKFAPTDDGGAVYVRMKGKPFDCKRCRAVLEQHHANRLKVPT
jgi:hypothetical protein